MSMILLQNTFYIVVLIGLSIPLGNYIFKVMINKKVFLSKVINPIETQIYKLIGKEYLEPMNAKRYSFSVLIFSLVGFIFVWLLQMFQGYLPFNPESLSATSWDLAFNTSASFVTNTNWQAYSGENTLSYLTQFLGLTVQNFVSAATGIAILFVLIRGFVNRQKVDLGNFWVDITRITLYILIPLSFVFAITLVSQGVVQSLSPYKEVFTLENGISQVIPIGPAASQIAIKQLGTNGGGFFGANSAFPFENPNAFTNFLELISILLIPAALCVTYGKAVNDIKQGNSIYITMNDSIYHCVGCRNFK